MGRCGGCGEGVVIVGVVVFEGRCGGCQEGGAVVVGRCGG